MRLQPIGSNKMAAYAAAAIGHRATGAICRRCRSSGNDISFFQDETRERYVPHVIEPSAGADRATLAFLCEAFQEGKVPDEHGKSRARTVLRLHPRLAPVKAAIFPLVKKDDMPEVAQKIYRELTPHFNVF